MSKLPKSINGSECLTECINANTWSVHPITLELLIHDKPYCATKNPVYNDLSKYKYKVDNLDECDFIQISEKHFDGIVSPTVGFDGKIFLVYNYKINSFYRCFTWLDSNPEVPKYTKNRLLNISWQVYGLDRGIINDYIVNYYLNYIRTYWSGYIMESLKLHIRSKEEGVYFIAPDKVETNLNTDPEKLKLATKYILYQKITGNFVNNLLYQYIESYKDSWKIIQLHNYHIKKMMIEKLKNNN